jgi:hypothetical protein
MTEAEEACPHDRMETSVEALNIQRENADEGRAWVSEISEAGFPGRKLRVRAEKAHGVLEQARRVLRRRALAPSNSGVTGRLAASHIAHFVIRTPLTGTASSASTSPSPLRSSRPCARPSSPVWDRAPWVTASISKFGTENT